MATVLKKGQKADITKGNVGIKKILLGFGWQTNSSVDLDCAAFLLESSGKVRGDSDFVFYGNSNHDSGSVEHLGKNLSGGDVEQIKIDLSKIPAQIEKIDLTATIYEPEERRQNFSMVKGAYIRIIDAETRMEILRFDLENFSVETAIVVGEIYRYKGEWKFNAIGAGYSGGLAALCKSFGIDVSDSQPTQSTPQSKPNRPTQTPPSAPKKIELKKHQKVNLTKKKDQPLGEIVINLNWSQPARMNDRRHENSILDRIDSFISSKKSNAIDLDLACLYELKDGRKGVVQALGNTFGNLNSAPYIQLDGDDRTGSVASGETIRVNGNQIDKIKRILVFTFIYDGVANWREADGIVTVKCPGNPDIIVRMDEYGSYKILCGIALLENQGGTFSVEKIVEFFNGHRELDEAFNWGLKWQRGTKD